MIFHPAARIYPGAASFFIATDLLRTPHTVPAVVTQVAVAVADGDGAAVVARRGIELEAGELIAADGAREAGVVQLASWGIEQLSARLFATLGRMAVATLWRMAVAIRPV